MIVQLYEFWYRTPYQACVMEIIVSIQTLEEVRSRYYYNAAEIAVQRHLGSLPDYELAALNEAISRGCWYDFSLNLLRNYSFSRVLFDVIGRELFEKQFKASTQQNQPKQRRLEC